LIGELSRKGIAITIIVLLIGLTLIPLALCDSVANFGSLTVKLNIDPYTIIYEGDIINCNITGKPTIKFWRINNQSEHTTFHDDDPVIFDPESTPLNANFVNLTVYVENAAGNDSDTVQVKVKKIYFGDIHWHSILSDGLYPMVTMYKNARIDNYLDFACSTAHAEFWCLKINPLFPFAWKRIKNLASNHYIHGKFTTFLAYEYSGSKINAGNKKYPFKGDTSHINFYYKKVYPDAPRYSGMIKRKYLDILKAMGKEWDDGHQNIGFLHHPLTGNQKIKDFISSDKISLNFSVNWTNFVNKMDDDVFRNNALKVLRGVEVYSKWGTAIGKYSGIPVNWNYDPQVIYDHPDYWIENALWEWSENKYTRGHRFVMQASSDTHFIDRPGSADLSKSRVTRNKHNPAGILAAFAVHNTREEIWDAINNCSIYGTQLLKIRANVRFDNQMALGQWINCSSPLQVRVTAYSTFPGYDSSNKSMKPACYSSEELDYPIQDIWLVKKDRKNGRPWCKIIGHESPNNDIAVVTFYDDDVHPNDFYYVAIKQKGQELRYGEDEYMVFIGPVFIKNVVET